MNAIIIGIGDELLIGQVINTNASWIARELNLIGIEVTQLLAVADNKSEIMSAIREAHDKAGIIVMTGGLGPTKDDITKRTLCDYYGTKMIFDETVYKQIEHFFKIRGYKVTEVNRAQAEVPECCSVIPNMHGTAPGMWFEQNNKILISLPGVPFEMEALMKESIIPQLKNKFSDQAIVHKTILTQGVGESFLCERISDWENNLPENIKLAYLPSPGLVKLRLSAKGPNKTEIESQINEQINKLFKLIPEYIFGEDDETLETIIGGLLKKFNKTISVAESCTGGYLSHRITSVPGSSVYFKGSVISYSNDVKIYFLDVYEQSLIDHGAVSRQVAEEMAVNIRKKFSTDYSVATTGVAGPDGGTKEKPVGTVWVAVSSEKSTHSEKFLFGENRERNIMRSTVTALNKLRKLIIEENENTPPDAEKKELAQW